MTPSPDQPTLPESGAFSGPDHAFMRRALHVAMGGFGRTKPNPLVGAVIVKDGVVLAEGFHTRCGAPHAEVEALARAGDAARGADLYVTLEPCAHHGRTPPCADAIIRAGIRRVVCSTADPNPTAGGGFQQLRQAGIVVETGLCADEAERQNEPFLTAMRRQRPYILLKAALSLDGYMATATGDSGQNRGGLSGPESHQRVQQDRAALMAILVGAGVVAADNPRLTVRTIEGATQPRKVVLDGRLSMNPEAQLFRNVDEPPLIYACAGADPVKAAALRAKGGEVTLLRPDAGPDGAASGILPAAAVCADLWRRGITSVLVEGGSQVHRAFLRAGLWDRLDIYLTPRLFGGGVPFSADLGVRLLGDAVSLRFESVAPLGRDILIVARPA